jgi:hypothetical protein
MIGEDDKIARKQETEILDNSDDAGEVVPVKYEITIGSFRKSV